MASMRRALLLLLALLVQQLHTALIILSSHAHHAHGDSVTAYHHLPMPFHCHPDQAKQLLKLKDSFSFSYSTTTTLSSWRDGTDCCLWEGVGCDDPSSGNVTILDLHNRGLVSYGLDPAVFSLTSLRRLDLSMNDFSGAAVDDGDLSMNQFSGDPFNEGIHWLAENIPATGFERFTLLTHLNLSYMGLRGPIPAGIGRLVNLLSLDLSSSFPTDGYDVSNSYFDNVYLLWVPSFDTLMANLSNLRELYLDGVDLSSSEEGWCTTLATYVPHLEILSMANCFLNGPICKSLSRLSSLTVLNLQNNYIIGGPFPRFLMDFLNLTMLQLSNTNLQGQFPSRPFQSKNLRVLDLSDNQNLTGHVPKFSNASSLESLMLDGTNLLPVDKVKPTSTTNFMSLKELRLSGNLVSVDFLSSFGILGSLCKLDLTVNTVSELGPVFSWIGHHNNLTSLVLSGNFSEITPTLVNNFKALRSLSMHFCTLSSHVLHAVGNLIGLQTLELFHCDIMWDSTMPSSIGNLTNLRNMHIDECGFSGPIPATIGRLVNLRNMYVFFSGFSGPIQATIGNLTNLESLHIEDGFSGPIPATIGKLTNLRTMYIGMNSSLLSGPVPDTIGNLTHLNTMGIFGQFYGSSIPYTIGQLSKLVRLHIVGSNFSESIPSSMANLTQLTELILQDNSLNDTNILAQGFTYAYIKVDWDR
uniref:Cf2-like protein n=1 Tax=Zea mays TaxID=4577 RepID=Q6J9V7_MAIZE|nr:cf2-like protein [Zea mays]